MRNLKKFLALVLATLMMVSAAAVVSADFTDVAADNRYAAAINDLAVKGIVRGTTETTFDPTADVTRTQMAIFLARTLSGETEDDARWAKGIVPYTDVTEYAGAIEYVQVKGLINGWTDINGKLVFGPKDNVTYVQALKMAIGALGYTEELAWPWGYYNKAVELGLTANMDVTELDAQLNRAETAQIIYNVLYAEPAEGGLTIAEANFGIATAANTDLFVITATPKQYYAIDRDNTKYDANASEVDGDYVGIQALINGVPDGNMIYVPVEALGIAVADVENYFNYAVELVNYNKKTGDFDNAILGEAPVVVDYTKVTVGSAGTSKAKIDGKTYTTVDGFTGATLNNEIVVYNGSLRADKAQMLVMDEDGYVYVGDGEPVGKLAYTSSNGTRYFHKYAYTYIASTIDAATATAIWGENFIVNSRDYVYVDGELMGELASGEGATAKYHVYAYSAAGIVSESEALELWGINVLDEAGAYVEYATMKAGELYNDAYQLSLFDDDRDGLYERAVYTPIYMGVYYTYKGDVTDKDTVCDGLVKDLYPTKVWASDTGVAATAVTYTDAAAKEYGAISVFTFNAQLNKVNVIDVLDVQTGTIDKVNGTGFRSPVDNTANTIKITVDGTVYTVAYDLSKAAKLYEDEKGDVLDNSKYVLTDAQLGANILKKARLYGATVDELGDEAFLQIDATATDKSKNVLTKFVDETWVDTDIAFVAYNGYILMLDVIESEDVYNFALVDDWSDFDLGEIYMDLWIAGEIEEDATVIEIDGKELADLSTTKFSVLLSRDEYFWPGNLYAIDVEDGNYKLNTLIDETNYAAHGLENAKVADDVYTEIAEGIENNNGSYDLIVDDKDNADPSDDEKENYTDANAYAGKIEFENGNSKTTNANNRLRTNDDTVFYFVEYKYKKDAPRQAQYETDEYDRVVKVFTGDVADGLWIKYDQLTQIYTDTLGRGDRASVVFVINPVKTNFFASELTYIVGTIANNYGLEVDYGSEFGLPEEYEDEIVYAYHGTFLDALTAEKVASTVYTLSAKDYTNWGNSIFWINEDNMIVKVEEVEGTLEGDVNFNTASAAITNNNNAGAHTVLQYVESTRDWAKYGISDKNGHTNNAANSAWGKPGTSGLDYYDWYYAKETGDYSREALEQNDVDRFPATIHDVTLKASIFEIDYDGDWLKTLKINKTHVNEDKPGIYNDQGTKLEGITAVSPEIEEDYVFVTPRKNQDIEVKVFNWANPNGVTGEEAYKILATAPRVWFVKDLDEAMADGVMEFYVITTNDDQK